MRFPPCGSGRGGGITLLEPAELRTRGFEVLVRSLSWINTVRFIQQYEPSRRNDTAERDAILPNWDAAEMVHQMKAIEPE